MLFRNVLQNLVLPGLVLNAPIEMYARLNELVRFQMDEPLLVFKDGGRARFDTFYNGLTVGAWKERCEIGELGLRLRGEGKFLLRLGLHRFGDSHRWLDEKQISLRAGEVLTLPLAF